MIREKVFNVTWFDELMWKNRVYDDRLLQMTSGSSFRESFSFLSISPHGMHSLTWPYHVLFDA